MTTIDIRQIEPEYQHTTARQAGRDVDDGLELHLSRFTVTLALKYKANSGERMTNYYDVVFSVSHGNETVTLSSFGDSNSKRQSFAAEKMATALEYAHRAAIAFVEDVGPDYHVVGMDEITSGEATKAGGEDVHIHSALEVSR